MRRLACLLGACSWASSHRLGLEPRLHLLDTASSGNALFQSWH